MKIFYYTPEQLEADYDRWLQENGGKEVNEEDVEYKPGGSTPSQYAIPEGCKELIDLIEYRNMNFSIGNIFKAAYRMGSCSHADKLYDLRKIIFFAERELRREEGR